MSNIIELRKPNYMVDLWKHKNYNTDKWEHNYIHTYGELFSDLREKEITLLEIGVQFGGSLEMWRDYFVNGTIYGLDTDGSDFTCDSTDKEAVEEEFKFRGRVDMTFDIIIDDGAHQVPKQVETFKNFIPMLKQGGIYVVEDFRGNGDRTPNPEEGSVNINLFTTEIGQISNTEHSQKVPFEFELIDCRKFDEKTKEITTDFKKKLNDSFLMVLGK